MNIINVGYQSTNYYLLEIKGGKLMVDCGWPGTFTRFAAEFKRKGISPGEVKYILVTHFHPDHAGLVQEFKDLGAKLILMESQVGFVNSFAESFTEKKVHYTEIKVDDNLVLKFKDSRKFLSDLGIAGEIISTPGHSDDSVTLILDDGFAFTGDLHPQEMATEEQRAATQKSWDEIHRHKITRVFPGHGN